jgi:hypothetical protein
VLDAARAAQQLPGVGAGGRVLLAGHSEGGHAPLWAAELAASYAPQLQVAGVAALAPGADLPELVRLAGARPAGLTSVPIYCSMILHLISYHIVSLSNPSFTRSAHHSCEMGEQSLDEPRFWSE